MILSLFIPNFFLCLGNCEVATNTETGNQLYKWDEKKWLFSERIVSIIFHISYSKPWYKKNPSPFLFSRWIREWLGLFARRLSTQSRVQSKFIPGNKFRASYWWGKLSRDDASDDKYRVSRIIELIAIMKYYCHVWRYWSYQDSH